MLSSISKSEVRDILLSAVLLTLAAAEFATSVTSHCLTFRVCMYQTVMMALLSIGDVWFRYFHQNKRKKLDSQRALLICCTGVGKVQMLYQQPATLRLVLQRRYNAERAWCLWLVAAYVAVIGLSFEDLLHATRMLVYKHDVGEHQPPALLALVAVDFCIKFANCIVLSWFRDSYILLNRPLMFLYHLAPPFCVITTASMVRLKLKVDLAVIWLDPVLTVALCIMLAALLVRPVLRLMSLLLLSRPHDLDVDEFEKEFTKQFPTCRMHELHAWQDTLRQNRVTLHIQCSINDNQSMTSDDCDALVADVRRFTRTRFANADHITVQPEFIKPTPTTSTKQCEYECSNLECLGKLCCFRHRNNSERTAA